MSKKFYEVIVIDHRLIACILIFIFSTFCFSQHEHHGSQPEEKEKTPQAHAEHQHHEMEHVMNPAAEFLMNEGAGTGVNPASASMGMHMRKIGNWNLMTHGYAFLNSIQQSGPRGGDKVFSTNHLMFITERELNSRSSLMARVMLSFEPGTITDRRYPLLFQTGETAFGQAIVDGQHPHDLFMEISLQYTLGINENTLVHFYAAPMGDPALGPVAYPHRTSAQELPQATLAHHLQDSTHIAANVLTGGLKYKWARIEVCGFHGEEPDEERWNIEQGAIDSWSTRLTLTPTPNWAGQISTGKLKHPEALEAGDIERTTASVSYNRPLTDGFWASSAIWGRNHKTLEDLNVNSFTFETLWQFAHKNNLTGRLEFVDKEELFANDHAVEEQLQETTGTVFNIRAFTLGYARDFDLIPGLLDLGVGGNFTLYSFPQELEPFYGENPKGFLIYLRIRSGHGSRHQM